MKQVAAAIARMGAAEAAAFEAGRGVEITLDNGDRIAIEAADVTVQRIPREGLVVAAEGEIVIAIETTLTPELVEEGLAREFVSRVQNLRKAASRARRSSWPRTDATPRNSSSRAPASCTRDA